MLPQTRSLTLGALIGAPTVREGLPPIAQHHTVTALVVCANAVAEGVDARFGLGGREWLGRQGRGEKTSALHDESHHISGGQQAQGG